MACQSDFFLKAYERAWNTRLAMMRDMVAQGVSGPLEVIHRLKTFEIDNTLTPDGTFAPRSFGSETQRLPTGVPIYRARPFLGEYHPGPFYDDHVEFMLHYLTQHKFDAIVELGSGYGRNLVELFLRGGPKDVTYFAGEISASGREAAEMLFALIPQMKVVSFPFDHKAPDLSRLAGFESVLLFTYHSIEQVTAIDDDYFRRLAACAPKVTAMHFEPFGFQLADHDGEPSQMQRELFERFDWNRNFARTVVEAHNAGDIRLIYLGKEMAGGHAENPTSLAMWQNP